jgi:ATP-dependent DNA helicase DinG
MRRRAAESDIIIVNHHLFFADLSIKLEAEGAPDAGVLPDCGAVIFDEAHELEDIAGNYFGISVSNLRMDELTRDVEHLLQREKLYTPQMSGAIQSVRERSQLFFSLLPANEGRFAFDSRREFLEENGEEFLALNQSLYRLGAELEQLPQKPEEVFTLVRRAQQLQVQLRFVMENEDPNTVFWIERRGFRGAPGASTGARRFKSSVFEKEALAPAGRPHECFSAGHSDRSRPDSARVPVVEAGNFGADLGHTGRRRRFRIHTAAARPRSRARTDRRLALRLRKPGDPLRPARSARSAHAAIRRARLPAYSPLARDHARARLRALHQLRADERNLRPLLGLLEYPMLKQGDAPKSALLEEFRLTPNAVLFGTSSFWQGVDVQGEQLSCVIIDRLPFAVPSDPVVAARVKAIDAGGGNAFFEYQVPSAVITLKQGFGRLIRSLHDRGLLALLDNRILKKQYGRVFVESLPPYSKTTDLRK